MSLGYEDHNFTVNESLLKEVDIFTYLGPSLSENTCDDHEITIRIEKASTVFGRLTKHVWKNQHLSIRTKVRVYEAYVLSILLYGAVTWATYRQHESRLKVFHTG